MTSHHDPILIRMDDDAATHLITFRDRAEWERTHDQRLGPLWARAFENALKVAGILSVGCAAEEGLNSLSCPRISLDIAKYSTKFVDHCIRRTIYLGREEIADNESERAVNKIRNYIYRMVHDWERTSAPRDQKYKERNLDGLVALSQITKRFQNMKRTLKEEALNTLEDSGEILRDSGEGDDRTTWYQLND